MISITMLSIQLGLAGFAMLPFLNCERKRSIW